MSDTNLNLIENDDDLESLNKINAVRKRLMRYITIEKFIDFVKESIKSSKSFSFRTANAEKYIDKNNPSFILRMNNLEIDKKKINDEKYLKDITNDITVLIKEEIINNISDFLIKEISNNEEIKEIYNSLDDEFKNPSFINVFVIRVAPQDNMIYLNYFI